jgi:hypothetical protein
LDNSTSKFKHCKKCSRWNRTKYSFNCFWRRNSNSITGATELYNGTSWTNSTSIYQLQVEVVSRWSCRNTTSWISRLVLQVLLHTNATEEFTNNALVVPVAGSWSSGGNLNTAKIFISWSWNTNS